MAREGSRSLSPTTALLAAACEGDLPARDRLVARYEPRLRNLVRQYLGPQRFRAEGEDLLQNIHVALIQSLPGLRERNEAAFRSWLNRLVQSRILDYERARRRLCRCPQSPLQALLATSGPVIAARTPTPSKILIGKEQRMRLEQAIGLVPERYQELLWYILVEAPSPEALTRFLRRPPEAARKFVSRALAHLQQVLRTMPE